MASSAVIGTLVAKLTADTAQFEGGMQRATKATQATEKAIAKTGTEVSRLTPQAERMVKAFGGDKLLYQANSLTAAVGKLGGAQKLTATEQAKVNATLSAAIEKYKSLGQQAPAALKALHQATKPASDITSSFGTKLSAVTGLVSGFAVGLGVTAVAALVQFGGEAARNAQRLSVLSTSFDRLTGAMGLSADEMMTTMRGATKGLVNDMDLMQSANKAMLLGLPVTTQSMGELSRAAVTLGRAMGQDATKSLDDLITALGRSSPLILDNLGLTVKVGEANDKYAKSLNKSAEDLTDAEKKLAFYTAAMEAARKKTSELGEIQLTVTDQLGRLTVSVGNYITKVVSGANESKDFSDAIGGIADAAAAAAQNLDDLAAARKRAGVDRSDPFQMFLGNQNDNPRVQRELDRIIRRRVFGMASRGAPMGDDTFAPRGLAQPSGLAVPHAPFDFEIDKIQKASADLLDAIEKANDKAKKAAAEAKQLAAQIADLTIKEQAAGWWAQVEPIGRVTDELADLTEQYKMLDAARQLEFTPPAQVRPLMETDDPEIDALKKHYEKVDDLQKETYERATQRVQMFTYSVTDGFADMLVGARGFRDGFLDIWHGIQRAIATILSDILNNFLTDFLGGLIKGIAGANLGKALGQAITGGAAGAVLGAGASAATGAAAAGGAGAAGAGAAGGIGSTVAGLATNPLTWAAAGAVLLGWGIAKKGWFRGGEEATVVNPRRDQFLKQFGPAGTGPQSGFHNLAKQLTAWSGVPNGGPLFDRLKSADTLKAFQSVERDIAGEFASHGKRGVKLYNLGGFVPPGVTQPAILHGGGMGEVVIPLDKIKGSLGRGGASITNVYINGLIDGRTVDEIFEKYGPRNIMRLTLMNRDGLTTALRTAVNR